MPDILPEDQKDGRTEGCKRLRERESQTDDKGGSGSHCFETPARFRSAPTLPIFQNEMLVCDNCHIELALG